MTFVRLGCITLAVFLPACGGSTDTDSSGSGGGTGGSGGASSGGTSGSGGSGGNGGCTSLVSCCDSSGNPVDYLCQNGMPVCPVGSSFPSSGTCTPNPSVCKPNAPCSQSEYCDYPDNLCGEGAEGTCKPKPTGCDFNYAPVCTCDGTVAPNDCAGYTAGNDIAANAKCAPPDNTFACGNVFCETGFQYCQRAVSDVGGEPDSYSCKPVPESCGKTPTCACLASEPCGQWCEVAALAELTLTCPGG